MKADGSEVESVNVPQRDGSHTNAALEMTRFVEVAPSAASFIESLRDIGYTFKHAIADIIDNSLAAGSTKIDIDVSVGRDELSLSIMDNGSGMSPHELFRAMRLGSRSPRETRALDDLGRFGLGLKTASFSQCRRLSVFTRRNGESSGAIWDLDHVQASDSWQIGIPGDAVVEERLSEMSGDGTLVCWDQLDRIATQPLTDQDIRDITALLDDARSHLEIVFHRFLVREGRHPAVTVTLNGRALEPFDPFWIGHPNTTATPPEPERISFRQGTVEIQAFTLPHHSNCDRSEWDAHAGPGGYVANQGFYLYRARRLLVWGTWFGLDRRRETNQLCRVRIDVDNSLDADWKVDIRKSSAQPPVEIRRRLKALVDRMMVGTKRVYRQRGQRLVSPDAYPIWLRHVGEKGYYYTPDTSHPYIRAFENSLSETDSAEFRKIVSLIGASLPYGAILSDAGDNPDGHSGEGIDGHSRAEVAVEVVRALISEGLTMDDALTVTGRYPAFSKEWGELAVEVRKTLADSVENGWEDT